MNEITKDLLKTVSDWDGKFDGAYNIRENSRCAARQSTENIIISDNPGRGGLLITVRPGTKGETVYIPACVTTGGIEDLVYNDFIIGEDADVTIVAGCGVHAEHGERSRHTGIHSFSLARASRVKYIEKHIGTGENSEKAIDPVTEAEIGEDATLEMDTSQLGGVSHAVRKMSATLSDGAKLIVRERILTDNDETAETDFTVSLNGRGSGADVVSRAVARGNSSQRFLSTVIGNAECTGHTECDAIIAENGRVSAIPALEANSADAALIHEAAIGKIAGEQIIKLQTLGLDEKQAESRIIEGFLR